MTIDELYTRLFNDGFADLLVKNAEGLSISDLAIEQEGQVFRVGQKERGRFCGVDVETNDEAEACSHYLANALRFSWHLTHSGDLAKIEQQQKALNDQNIWFDRNDLPESLNLKNARYRLFVLGRDLKRSRALLGLS